MAQAPFALGDRVLFQTGTPAVVIRAIFMAAEVDHPAAAFRAPTSLPTRLTVRRSQHALPVFAATTFYTYDVLLARF